MATSVNATNTVSAVEKAIIMWRILSWRRCQLCPAPRTPLSIRWQILQRGQL